MENHIWSIIARRMKHNHTSWSIKGGNHLAKILAKKCSGRLYEVTEQLKIPVFEEEKLEEIKGCGYAYPVIGHVVRIDTGTRGDRGKLHSIAGF